MPAGAWCSAAAWVPQVTWAVLAPPEPDPPSAPPPEVQPSSRSARCSDRRQAFGAECRLLRSRARAQLALLGDPVDRAIARCALNEVRRLHHLRWHPAAHGYSAADRGAVGKHLERLVADRLSRRRRWQFHLTIDDETGQVRSIGCRPGGSGHTTQIDAIHLRAGAPRFVPGEPFDPSRVSHAYEIKASSHGRIDQGQHRRIAALLGSLPLRRLHVSVARFCAAQGRWVVNEQFARVVQVLPSPPALLPPAAQAAELALWPRPESAQPRAVIVAALAPPDSDPPWLARARRLACSLAPDDTLAVAIAPARGVVPPAWYALCWRPTDDPTRRP